MNTFSSGMHIFFYSLIFKLLLYYIEKIIKIVIIIILLLIPSSPSPQTEPKKKTLKRKVQTINIADDISAEYDPAGSTEPFGADSIASNLIQQQAQVSPEGKQLIVTNRSDFKLNANASSSSSGGYSAGKQFDLNLAPLETRTSRYIPPYSIYVGNGIVLQINKFKADYYVAFGKEEEDGLIKSRINVPIRYIESLKRGILALESHINNCNY